MLAPTDGTASGHEGCKKPKAIPISESALRDVEATAIGQQVLAFKAATGRGIDEASDRRLAARHAVPASFDQNLPPMAHLSSPTTSLFVTSVTLLPVQKIANGLSGDPVPFSMRSGAAENRNS